MASSRAGIGNKTWDAVADWRDDDQWRKQASCAEVDPDLWHPEKGDSSSSRRAIRLCRQECPVRAECLAYALAVGEGNGIYGGFSGRNRRPFADAVRNGVAPEDAAVAAIYGEQVLQRCG